MSGRANDLNLMRGVSVGRKESLCVLLLFLGDDTLIFSQPDLRNLLHLLCVLMCFQAVSGFKINLNKSELVRIGGNGEVGIFARVLGCKEVKFPFKYLGTPLSAKYKDLITWELMIELFEKRLARWKKNFFRKG